jgi:hypothetical protein
VLPAKEIVFFGVPRQNAGVIGAFLNALGILAGALFGCTYRQPLSARVQQFFKSALGVLTFGCGAALLWLNVNGTFLAGVKQLFLAALAVVLGNWLGRLLRLQKMSNRIGRHAAGLIATAQKKPPGRSMDGLIAATLLFCAAPLGLIGAVTDGLNYFFYLLALKAVMDGLAMVSFVKIFRWPAALAAIPVLIFLNSLTLAVHFYAAPFLDTHHWINAVGAAGGLIVCATALVIFEVRRVELANYLPALALAPLVAKLFN